MNRRRGQVSTSGTRPSALDRREFLAMLAAPWLVETLGGCRRSAPESEKGALAQAAHEVEVDVRGDEGPFQRLSGVQGSPLPIIEGEPDLTAEYRAHDIANVRVDQDCYPNTLTLGGIFPDEKADPEQASSYHFGEIDKHLAAARAAGAAVLWQASYDIGRSDHWYDLNLGGRAVVDVDRWSRVVERCLEHFTTGWASGLDAAVAHVEFLNEPSGLGGFHGPHAARLVPTFLRFLETVERFNRAHPERPVKAVGPGIPFSIAEWPEWRPKFAEALRKVREAGRSLPVFSFHTYGDDTSPTGNARLARELRTLLDEHGMQATELWNTEWQAGDFLRSHLEIDDRRVRNATKGDVALYGHALAGYALACKARWQGVLTGSYYYRANRRAFPEGKQPPSPKFGRGLAGFFSAEKVPGPLAFQEQLMAKVAAGTPTRCRTELAADGLLTAVGVRSTDGRSFGVLLTSLAKTARNVTVRFAGIEQDGPVSARALLLGRDHEGLAEQALVVPAVAGHGVTVSTSLAPFSSVYVRMGREG